MTQRLRRHPFLALFDGADPNASTAGRNVTTVPTQALFFLNNPLVHLESDRLAGRLLGEGRSDRDRVGRLYALALARPATEPEQDEAVRYLDDARALLARDGRAPDRATRDAWASLVRTMMASNEFLYVD